MNKIFRLGLMAFTALLGFSACQDDFGDPHMSAPVAINKPNTTIAELKDSLWQDANNYCEKIGTKGDGSHYIISGRVISSDYDGNIFKCLYIQDETGALPMSINQYNLYLTHRRGQEVVIDLTDMYAGKYNGMFQLGFPSWYEREQAYETSFMAPELFNAHCELNGTPNLAALDTITITDLSTIGSSPEELKKWQGQLVRFNNVTFANAGQPGQMLCNTYHSSGENQAITIGGGGSLNVRTSGYAKFWNTPLPTEACDIVGILGYYGTQGWQLSLIDKNGLMNVGNPTQKGTSEQPYTITEAAALPGTTGWVKGYIVGTPAPEVTSITSMADVATSNFIIDNYVVLATAPTTAGLSTKDLMVVSLPEGTPIADYVNLVAHPENLGKEIAINGIFTSALSISAVKTAGAIADFKLEGLEIVDPNAPVAAGDGTEGKPYNVTQVIGLGNPGTEAWVEGFIVGWYDYNNNSSLVTTLEGTVANSNIALAASPTETTQANTVAVQLPVGDMRTALNLKDHPENLGKKVAIKGKLMKYFGVAGIKECTAFKLDGGADGGETPGGGEETPNPPAVDTTGAGTDASPYTVDDVFALNNPTGAPLAWVEGYIVGSFASTAKITFGAEGAVDTNLALAASPTETDFAKCIPVALPTNTDVRTALNLVANPENAGRKVKVQGTLEPYYKKPGVKGTKAYQF